MSRSHLRTFSVLYIVCIEIGVFQTFWELTLCMRRTSGYSFGPSTTGIRSKRDILNVWLLFSYHGRSFSEYIVSFFFQRTFGYAFFLHTTKYVFQDGLSIDRVPKHL